jgi:uncharacterized protein YabN with tetrapyrrole methylase and pyrophosphatase domain
VSSERWELDKQREKGRESIFDGIPPGLPALAYATKVRKKAEVLGVVVPAQSIASLGSSALDDASADELAIGELLFAVVDLARRAEVDPEAALRVAADRYRDEVRVSELDRDSSSAG